MTREEAATIIERIADFAQVAPGGIEIHRWDKETAIKAMRAAIAALRGPQPDPITGLVPCGCGGKAGFHYSVMMRDNDCYVGCGICGGHTKVVLSEDEARDAWNTAMGWKGGAE